MLLIAPGLLLDLWVVGLLMKRRGSGHVLDLDRRAILLPKRVRPSGVRLSLLHSQGKRRLSRAQPGKGRGSKAPGCRGRWLDPGCPC